MKVTVCFGNVRVVVPCGRGHFLVSDLIEKAVLRYKKAICKPSDYWVSVHNLKSSDDDGILDADDQLSDVVDDKDQIIAIYDEQGAPPVPHNGGDGTSASSVGTSSPDIFQSGEPLDARHFNGVFRGPSENDVIITHNDINVDCGLRVRRGSEPVLADITLTPTKHPLSLLPSTPSPASDAPADQVEIFPWQPSKQIAAKEAGLSAQQGAPPRLAPRLGGSGREKSVSPERAAGTAAVAAVVDGGGGGGGGGGRFSRDVSRRSLANNGNLFRWLEAQRNQQDAFERHRRKEPLGGSGRREDEEEASLSLPSSSQEPSISDTRDVSILVCLKNTKEPLGIHVVPDYDDSGRDMGLVIEGIEEGRRVQKDGRLHIHDRIIEINGTGLVDLDFNKAQDIFKAALQSDEIRLRVVSSAGAPTPLSSAGAPPPSLPTTEPPPSSSSSGVAFDASVALQRSRTSSASSSTPSSPTKRVPPAVPARHPSTSLTDNGPSPPPPSSSSPPSTLAPPAARSPSPKKAAIIAPTNTRRMGKQISIDLLKGAPGLGFSVTTRDNPAGGTCPIYIKNIVPGGAAISDGRLLIGDRLLKVNGVDLAGKTQMDAVSYLKKSPMGQYVQLLISRQVIDDGDTPTSIRSGSDGSARSSPGVGTDEGAGGGRETVEVEIALREGGGPAALGISVKSKTRDGPLGPDDLGVFIKSVISGGAAARDGRLRANDRLLRVNGCSLERVDNETALRRLRDAMLTSRDGDASRCVTITVSRRVAAAAVAVPAARCRELKVSQSEVFEEEIPDAPQLTNRRLCALRCEGSPPGLRNTSYQMANRDSPVAKVVTPPPEVKDDDDERELEATTRSKRAETSKARPASTIGFLHPPTPDSGKMAASRSNELLNQQGAPSPPEWLTEWERAQESGGEEEGEEGEDTEEALGEGAFQREGFARQSMSEKRKKANLDPRLLEFYQKVKEVKESKGDTTAFYSATWHPRRRPRSVQEDSEDTVSPGPPRRAGSVESLVSNSNGHMREPQDRRGSLAGEVGPTLGLRKSSSLESLQSVVQEASADAAGGAGAPGGALWKAPNRGIVRGRGCNESFRAAVDRSYENAGGVTEPAGGAMEPLDEEESEVGSAGQGHSQRSSFSGSDNASEDGRRRKKSIKDKEKGKLLKGLGSMFRFGRHRKPLEDRAPKQTASDMHSGRQAEGAAGPGGGGGEGRRAHRAQSQPAKTKPAPPPPPPAAPPGGGQERVGQERVDRILQLRAEHQRRHRERHRRYPHDDDVDDGDGDGGGDGGATEYERQIAEWESDMRRQYGEYAVPPPPRRTPPEPFDRWRPSSVVPPPPPPPSSSSSSVAADRCAHYENLEQIQESLRLHDYYAQQYHSYMAQQQQQHHQHHQHHQQQQQQHQQHQQERDRQARRAPYPQPRDHASMGGGATEWPPAEPPRYVGAPPPPSEMHRGASWLQQRHSPTVNGGYAGHPPGGHPPAGPPPGGHAPGRLVSMPAQMHYRRPAAPTAAFIYDRHGPHYASLPRQHAGGGDGGDGRHASTTSAQV